MTHRRQEALLPAYRAGAQRALRALLVCCALVYLIFALHQPVRAQDEPRVEVAEVEGAVFSIDRERETVRLRMGEAEYLTVEVHRGTAFRGASGAEIGFRDLRVGDVVAVRGERRDRYFIADSVSVVRSAGSPRENARPEQETRANLIEGTVRRPTHLVSRHLRLRTDRGEVTIEVPKEVAIIKDFQRISVHEVRSGDRVRVHGFWEGESRFNAQRVYVANRSDGTYTEEALRDSRPGIRGSVVEGSIVAHDAARTRLRVNARGREYIVRTEAARIRLGQRSVGRTTLRRGDHVRATGRLRGMELFAQQIEIQ